jgi:phosphoserine phosphatase
VEKQRLEHSLEIAREIQQKLFPSQDPKLPGFDIATWNRPCEATGGDCCDFLRLTEELLIVTLGDVTGHGVGPALVSCATRAMLRAMSSVNEDIGVVTDKVNDLLTSDLADNCFVTVFLGALNGTTGELRYCSAGQGPLLWLHVNTNEVDIISANGFPMGIMTGAGYTTADTVKMQKGDVFALLTDGFYEWANSEGELFGINRVVEILQAVRQESAGDILKRIRKAAEEFANTKQADDLTAIIIKKI